MANKRADLLGEKKKRLTEGARFDNGYIIVMPGIV
jgi:hypothetical protein